MQQGTRNKRRPINGSTQHGFSTINARVYEKEKCLTQEKKPSNQHSGAKIKDYESQGVHGMTR